MTWTILQLAFPLVFLGIAFYLYQSSRPLLIGFREQLAVSPKGRRFVILMALLGLLVFHFVSLCGTANPLQLLPSSILTFLMFSQRYGEGIMRLYQRKHLRFPLFVLTLAAFFLPQTTPLAVTLLVFLITSWIYPTEELMKEVSERGDTPDIIEETIEGLSNKMTDFIPGISLDLKENDEESEDTDIMPVSEETPAETDAEEDADDTPSPSCQSSEKAVRRMKMHEKMRALRRSRAKRRARRARNGH